MRVGHCQAFILKSPLFEGFFLSAAERESGIELGYANVWPYTKLQFPDVMPVK